MRKTEEAAEATAREVARMRSELDALTRPIQQYVQAGSEERLRACSERLKELRQKLSTQHAQLQVPLCMITRRMTKCLTLSGSPFSSTSRLAARSTGNPAVRACLSCTGSLQTDSMCSG